MDKIMNLLEAETFDRAAFTEEVCSYVNSFGWYHKGIAEELDKAICGEALAEERMLNSATACIIALGTAQEWAIDRRNECAAAKCRELADALESDGFFTRIYADKRRNTSYGEESFLRQHRTLQQSAISFFCVWLDYMNQEGRLNTHPSLSRKLSEYRGEDEGWYRFPLV